MFDRVEQLPDVPLSFVGTFDGEPVEITRVEGDDATYAGVLRFGLRTIEAVSIALVFADYHGFIRVSAVDCGVYGGLARPTEDGMEELRLEQGSIQTLTRTVDGFTGMMSGTMHGEWSNDVGEQHVLDATFTLRASFPDGRAGWQ